MKSTRLEAHWSAPQWPTESFSELRAQLSKDGSSTTLEHPVLKRLRVSNEFTASMTSGKSGSSILNSAPPGERPVPLCMVAKEWRTGRTLRLWREESLAQRVPPYSLGPEALFVAYYASPNSAVTWHWAGPCRHRILDLFAEFRCLDIGLDRSMWQWPAGAMAYHGLDAIAGR